MLPADTPLVLAGAALLNAGPAQACSAQKIAAKFNAAIGLPANTPPKVMKASQKECVCAAESKQATIACLSPPKKETPAKEKAAGS